MTSADHRPLSSGRPWALLAARVRSLALLCAVVGTGLALQAGRAHDWTDAAGTILYVAAVASAVLVVLPQTSERRLCVVAGIAGAIALTVEWWQATGMPAELVRAFAPARLITGTTFSWGDVLWTVAAVPVVGTLLWIVHLDHVPRRVWWFGALVATGGAAGAVIGTVAASLATGRPSVGWAAWLAGFAVAVAGVIDVVRGVSRDDRRLDLDTLLGRFARALVVVVPAVIIVAGALSLAQTVFGSRPVLAAVALCAVLGVAATLGGIVGQSDGVLQRSRVLAAVTLAIITVLVAHLVGPARHADPYLGVNDPRTTPGHVPTADGTPELPLVRVPEPTPLSAAPDADADLPLCTADQLTGRTQGWDSAMGHSWVTIVVTNQRDRPCAVTGLPEIVLVQGAERITLDVDHESPDRSGVIERGRRALVRAGGEVAVVLGWPGHRTAADSRTPQALTLLAPEVGSIPVALDIGPAPFDLIDQGKISISGWR